MTCAGCGRRGRDVTDISRMTGHDRKTVRKYLRMDDFSLEAPAPRPRGTSKLDPFKDYIDRTLEADLHEWRKQRYAATRIYGEILGMGYEGRYSHQESGEREAADVSLANSCVVAGLGPITQVF